MTCQGCLRNLRVRRFDEVSPSPGAEEVESPLAKSGIPGVGIQPALVVCGTIGWLAALVEMFAIWVMICTQVLPDCSESLQLANTSNAGQPNDPRNTTVIHIPCDCSECLRSANTSYGGESIQARNTTVIQVPCNCSETPFARLPNASVLKECNETRNTTVIHAPCNCSETLCPDVANTSDVQGPNETRNTMLIPVTTEWESIFGADARCQAYGVQCTALEMLRLRGCDTDYLEHCTGFGTTSTTSTMTTSSTARSTTSSSFTSSSTSGTSISSTSISTSTSSITTSYSTTGTIVTSTLSTTTSFSTSWTSTTRTSTTCPFFCMEGFECAQNSRYGPPSAGLQQDLELACSEDTICRAYDWDAEKSYGFKCADTVVSSDEDLKHCTKCSDRRIDSSIATSTASSTTTSTALSTTTSTATRTASSTTTSTASSTATRTALSTTTGTASSTNSTTTQTFPTPSCEETAGSNYVCTQPFECPQIYRYGAPVYRSESHLALTCDADPRCQAYDWDGEKRYGFMCLDIRREPDEDFKLCMKCIGTSTTNTSTTTSTTNCGFICTSERQCSQSLRYFGPQNGAQIDLQEACHDDVGCMAYDWDTREGGGQGDGYGFLCSDVATFYDEHFMHCVKCTSTTTTTSLSISSTATGTMTSSSSSTDSTSSSFSSTSTTTCGFLCTPQLECDQPSRYGRTMSGPQTNMSEACFKDASCAAYDWDEIKGYGFLCSDVTEVFDVHKIHCVKCTTTTTTRTMSSMTQISSTTSASSTTPAPCYAIDTQCENMTVDCCPGLQCVDLTSLGLGFRCANDRCPAFTCVST